MRLIGNVSADPQTGQLTTTFAENPQVPFSSFRLQFDGGAKAPLTSPPTCGPNKTATQMTPWSGNAGRRPRRRLHADQRPRRRRLRENAGRAALRAELRRQTTNPKGGAYTQFAVNVARSDGNQELKGVDVNLPPRLDREAGRRALLPDGGDRRRGGQQRRGRGGQLELSRLEPGRQRLGQPPAAAPTRSTSTAKPSSQGAITAPPSPWQ